MFHRKDTTFQIKNKINLLSNKKYILQKIYAIYAIYAIFYKFDFQ